MSAADPRVDQYQTARIQLREAAYEKDGKLYYLHEDGPESIPFVPVALCNHGDRDRIDDEGSRICPDCVESWLCDWQVWLPADSPVFVGG